MENMRLKIKNSVVDPFGDVLTRDNIRWKASLQ